MKALIRFALPIAAVCALAVPSASWAQVRKHKPKSRAKPAPSQSQSQSQSPAPAPSGPCAKGVSAFASTLHPILLKNCLECHSHGPGPQHTLEDPAASYAKVKRYIDFMDIPSSVLVTKGGNGHCKQYGSDCAATSDELAKAVKEWWDQGEKSCALEGKLVTGAQPLPIPLPEQGKGFATLRWDLGQVSRALRGVIFEIDVQKFSDKSDTAAESYRFRRPRVIPPMGAQGPQAVRIEGLRVLVNGNFDPAENAFVPVNVHAQTIQRGEAFILSTRTEIVLADQGAAQDKISLAFDSISFEAPIHCADPLEFNNQLNQLRDACSQCHTGDDLKNPETFKLPALSRVDGVRQSELDRVLKQLGRELDQVCVAMLVRVNRKFVAQSPLLVYGVGRYGHPVVFQPEEAARLAKLLESVMKNEKAPNDY